jgi:hypothetical protein
MKTIHAAVLTAIPLLLAGCGGMSGSQPASCTLMTTTEIQQLNGTFNAYKNGESISAGFKADVNLDGPGTFPITVLYAVEVQPSGEVALFGGLENPSNGASAGEVPLNPTARASWPDAAPTTGVDKVLSAAKSDSAANVVACVTGMGDGTIAGASGRPVPLNPLPSTQSPKSAEDQCSGLESMARYRADYGNKPGVDKAMKEAKDLGCQFPRPKLIKPENAPSLGYVTPSMDGIVYKWADNPNCGYLPCFGMTVRADTVDCPNGLYAEINLIDKSGTIVGYANDLVGSLRTGQRARLIFAFSEDGVDRARLNKFSCY